jgi:iron complex outermembrane receptor protein
MRPRSGCLPDAVRDHFERPGLYRPRRGFPGRPVPYSASRNVYGTDGTQTQFERVKAWSDEFRITSPNAQSLRWMVGSYFLDTRRFISSSTGVDEGNGILQVTYQPHFNDPLNPTNSSLPITTTTRPMPSSATSAYDLTSKLEASFGFRYDHDNHRQTIRADSTAGVPSGCTVGNPDACVRETNFHRSQPKSRSITGRRPTSPSLPITASGSVRGSTTRPGRPRPRTFRASMIWPSPKAPIRPKAGSRRVFSTASCA